MGINKIHIDNFKSLVDFNLINPNPFSVFVGANGAGKSNLFEALEFLNFTHIFTNNLENFNDSNKIDNLFGGYKNFINFNRYNHLLSISIESEINNISIKRNPYDIPVTNKVMGRPANSESWDKNEPKIKEYHHFVENFSRIFINTKEEKKININSDEKLNFNCDNLELVLDRILKNELFALEIKEWLGLFRPGFDKIEVVNNQLSDTKSILFYEKGYTIPFNKKLISDGTYNILCLLTAIYQSDEPQFICIEEPENGLNPYVIKEFVHFFREQCKVKGHYIWLNSHSQTLVNQLTIEEIVVLNKEDGITKPKQFSGKNMHGLSLDEAWLTNVLGGGIPW